MIVNVFVIDLVVDVVLVVRLVIADDVAPVLVVSIDIVLVTGTGYWSCSCS